MNDLYVRHMALSDFTINCEANVGLFNEATEQTENGRIWVTLQGMEGERIDMEELIKGSNEAACRVPNSLVAPPWTLR